MILDPSTVAAVPWRNAVGSTRELAVVTDAEGVISWRVSLATLDGDAPFSQFSGLDRLFVALGPLHLTVEGDVTAMSSGDQARFAGDVPVSVAPDGPTTALNVMTRSGWYRPDVSLRRFDQPVPEGTDLTVLLPTGAADVRLHPAHPPEESDD